MKAILLVAGQSKRFWPLAEKPLFPVCGRPLAAHMVQRIRDGGIDDILVVASEDNVDSLRSALPNVQLVLQEDLTLGMQGALLSALPLCDDGPVLVVSGNDFFESSAFADLLSAAAKADVSGALLAQRTTSYFPGGYLRTDASGAILEIVEKPGAGNEPSDLVNIVAHIHNDPRSLLSALRSQPRGNDDGYERAVTALLSTHRYVAVPYSGVWRAVKYPWHLLEVNDVLLGGLAGQSVDPTAVIHPTAVLSGAVSIGAGTKVLAHATIAGPCFIGKDCLIANNALVRGSSVGDRCVAGFSTEIKSCVLADSVWTHMSYLGDSVVGSNVSFGAGFVTGNYRLDEGEVCSVVADAPVGTGRTKFGAAIGSHCRFGFQSGTNPGVKIGPETFVSSGTLVSRDLESGSFARMKDGALAVSPNAMRGSIGTDRSELMKKIVGG